MENINYNIYTIKGLRDMARKRGLRGYSTLRKAELIKHIENPPIIYTRAQLLQQAKDKGQKRYSTLRKADLIIVTFNIRSGYRYWNGKRTIFNTNTI